MSTPGAQWAGPLYDAEDLPAPDRFDEARRVFCAWIEELTGRPEVTRLTFDLDRLGSTVHWELDRDADPNVVASTAKELLLLRAMYARWDGRKLFADHDPLHHRLTARPGGLQVNAPDPV